MVLDASWIDAAERHRATALADEVSADLVQVQCYCPRELANRRIRQRRDCSSDATAEIAEAMSASAAPWPDAIPLDTDRPLEDTVADAFRAWQIGEEVAQQPLTSDPTSPGTSVTGSKLNSGVPNRIAP